MTEPTYTPDFHAQYLTVRPEPPREQQNAGERFHWDNVRDIAKTYPAILEMNYCQQSKIIADLHLSGKADFEGDTVSYSQQRANRGTKVRAEKSLFEAGYLGGEK